MGILSMGKSPRPICAVCNKRVEGMDIYQARIGSPLEITVQCHGEREIYTLDPKFATLMNHSTMVEKVFLPKKAIS